MKNNQITVVFLLRNGRDAHQNLKEFLFKLKNFPAGHPHELLYLIKGFNEKEVNKLMNKYELDPNNIVEVPDKYFDLGSYFYATSKIKTEYGLFLNSHARPQVKDWLKLYHKSLELNDTSLVGATGSYEANGFTVPFYNGTSLKDRIRWLQRFLYRLLLSFLNFNNNVAFPNRHIRSNAFLTKISLYKRYIQKHGLPNSKRKCHLFESGPNSFTRYVESKGLNPGSIDSDGHFFQLDRLHKAESFRRNNQNKLIISDNRTRQFQDSSNNIRLSLEWDSWRDRK